MKSKIDYHAIHQAWSEKVRRWEASGKSAQSWCKENDVVYSTFMSAKDRIKKNPPVRRKIKPPTFIELKDHSQKKSGLVIECQGLKIAIDQQFDEAILQRFLRVLRSALC